jgi:lysophospholipase L1-like esterase
MPAFLHRRSMASLLVAAAFTAIVAAPVAVKAMLSSEKPAAPSTSGKWVHTWTAMPQLTEPGNLPPAPYTQADRVLVDSTLRQTVHISLGGGLIRLRFSNAFGGSALPITAASIALPVDGKAGVSGIRPGTTRPLTFDGRSSVTVPVGAQIVSDPVALNVGAQSNLTVTMYLAQGQLTTNITSHPGSRTTSYLVPGNQVDAADLTGATTADHWYFISGVEAFEPDRAAGVVMLGDSLTDGRGSTTNQNDRWPDQLLQRLHADRHTANVAVLNQAAGGNRVLNDGLGPNALGRIDRDVLSTSGVAWLLVFEGVNDIGTADATDAAQTAVTADLIGAFDQIVTRAHAQGIKVYGATITPFGGNTGYDDPAGLRERSRQQVNTWIRTGHRFDAVVDFDKAARDPAQPRQLLPAYDVGDHLHMNPTGYRALADAVPSTLFRQDR